jgi:hypothetical protein
MRVAKTITISSDERKTLGKWARGRSTPARLILRAKIVLAAADGKLNQDIAAELGTGMKDCVLVAQSLCQVRPVWHRARRPARRVPA